MISLRKEENQITFSLAQVIDQCMNFLMIRSNSAYEYKEEKPLNNDPKRLRD